MTWDEEWEELKQWDMRICAEIEDKYPRSPKQLDCGIEKHEALMEQREKFNERLIILMEKYRSK